MGLGVVIWLSEILYCVDSNCHFVKQAKDEPPELGFREAHTYFFFLFSFFLLIHISLPKWGMREMESESEVMCLKMINHGTILI